MRKLASTRCGRITGFVLVAGLFGGGYLAAQTSPWPDSSNAQSRRDLKTEALCRMETPVLTLSDSIGPIKHGMLLSDIEEICPQIDRLWIRLEGTPSPVLVTRLGEIDLVIEMWSTASSARIYRVSTKSTAARTVDGVGPGIAIADVATAWPDLKIAFGEGTFAYI